MGSSTRWGAPPTEPAPTSAVTPAACLQDRVECPHPSGEDEAPDVCAGQCPPQPPGGEAPPSGLGGCCLNGEFWVASWVFIQSLTSEYGQLAQILLIFMGMSKTMLLLSETYGTFPPRTTAGVNLPTLTSQTHGPPLCSDLLTKVIRGY